MTRTKDSDNSKGIFNEGDMFCERCGQIIPHTTWEKRKSRGRTDWDHCTDCRALPVKNYSWQHPILGRITCIPYDGELDELWRPVNAVGDLYKPGERMCGMKDCVNTNHIVEQAKHTRYATELQKLLGQIEAQAHNKKTRTK